MKVIYLHVGFNKTATTSLQETLIKNQKLLMEKGYLYPKFNLDNQGIVNHSLPFYILFGADLESYRDLTRLKTKKEISEIQKLFDEQLTYHLRSSNKIIFSGEHIPLLTDEQLNNLKIKLSSLGHKIEVICYVRKPYSYLCSEIQQRIKASDYIFDRIKVPIKSNQILKLNRVFGKVDYLSFEAECLTMEGLIGRFINRLGCDYKKFNIVHKNEGMGNFTTRLLAHLNKKFPVMINNQFNANGRRNFPNLDSNKFRLTESELLLVLKDLDTENNKLKKLLGDKFVDIKPYSVIDKLKVRKLEAKKALDITVEQPQLKDEICNFILMHKDDSFNNNWPNKYLKVIEK